MDAYGYVVFVSDVESTLKFLYLDAATDPDCVDDVRAKVVFADGSTDTITVSKLNGDDITKALTEDTVYSYTVSGGKYKLTSAGTKFVKDTITYIADGTTKVITKGKADLNSDNGKVTYANANTVFVVKSGSSWEVYTGISNVPSLTAKDNKGSYSFMAYVAGGTDKYADVVFVTESNRSSASELSNSIYVLNKNASVSHDANGDEVYTYTVIFKGEKVEMQADTDLGVVPTGLYLNTSVTGNNVISKLGTYKAPSEALKAEAGIVQDANKTYTVNSDTVFLAVDGEDVTVVDLGYITAKTADNAGDMINIIPDNDNNDLAAYVFILE